MSSSGPIAVSSEVLAPRAPQIEGFTIEGEIGRGGFATVWAGRRAADGASVAIKIGNARGAGLVERFRREASAIARIGPPHAAALHEQGQLDDERPYIVMERLHGPTLAMEIRELAAPMPLERVARRADAILAALAAAHAQGITHRDLKPSNILLAPPHAPDDRVVLIDFGLAHAEFLQSEGAADLTRPGVALGTPAYMAPEQIRGEASVGPRTDIYAFGVILFELLTGRTPFVGDAGELEHGHVSLRPPRPSELAPVSAELDELTLACLAKDASRRPRSAAELRSALAAACSVLGTLPPSSAAQASSKGGLVAESGQPAVLLVVEASGAAPPIIAAVAGRGGFVARRRGIRYVSIFPAGQSESPPEAALAAARDLVERHGARASLHLANIALRTRPQGPPAAYGALIDRPEAWLPAEPWSGIHCTTLMEQALGELAHAPTAGSGETPLFGRDDIRAALTVSAAAAFSGACPGLFTLTADEGLGKSRLATEAVDVCRSLTPEARIISLRAAPVALDGGEAPETRTLLRALHDGSSGAPVPQRRELVRTLAEGLRKLAREQPVAVVLDDAHRADDALLDALEYATLDGAGIRLWVVVTAHPRFEALRPLWGARTQRHDRAALEPLEEEASVAFAAWLFQPADYLPLQALRGLARWTGGNPSALTDLARSLERGGALQRRSSGRGFDLIVDELVTLPPSAPRRWLAARRLAELPSTLTALARVCAVLGPAFTEEQLASVLERLDRAGSAGSPLDAGVGLSALAAAEIVAPAPGGGWVFRRASLQEELEAQTNTAHRTEIHRQALADLRERLASSEGAAETLDAIARHAAGCGQRAEAADAQIALAEAALAQHRHLEADRRYTAAVALLRDEGDLRVRARALAGRGRARYRTHHVQQARSDFAEALSLAGELGDARLTVELLLEDATALDWDRQFEASAARVSEAREALGALDDPALALQLAVAEGRTHHRRIESDAAIARLTEARASAAQQGAYEPRVVALLLLSFELAASGHLDEAERRFDEVIALTEEANDLPHLGAAYSNRVVLWTARGEPGRAVQDLERAVALAREIGNPWLEHAAAYNVALMLYRSDAQPEAIAYARRACLLAERAVEAPIPAAKTLLGEIFLALNQFDEAARLAEASDTELGGTEPAAVLAKELIRLVLAELEVTCEARPTKSWDELLQRTEDLGLPIESELRLLYWRARMALVNSRLGEATAALDAARARRPRSAMWHSRFEDLEAQRASALQRHGLLGAVEA